MIHVRIDVGRDVPLPDIAPMDPPTVIDQRDESALLAAMHFGPPQEVILSIEGRVQNLDMASSLVNAVAIALDHACLKEDGDAAQDQE